MSVVQVQQAHALVEMLEPVHGGERKPKNFVLGSTVVVREVMVQLGIHSYSPIALPVKGTVRALTRAV